MSYEEKITQGQLTFAATIDHVIAALWQELS
jgi:hypothetical protein